MGAEQRGPYESGAARSWSCDWMGRSQTYPIGRLGVCEVLMCVMWERARMTGLGRRGRGGRGSRIPFSSPLPSLPLNTNPGAALPPTTRPNTTRGGGGGVWTISHTSLLVGAEDQGQGLGLCVIRFGGGVRSSGWVGPGGGGGGQGPGWRAKFQWSRPLPPAFCHIMALMARSASTNVSWYHRSPTATAAPPGGVREWWDTGGGG